jgi:hypothetical protein
MLAIAFLARIYISRKTLNHRRQEILNLEIDRTEVKLERIYRSKAGKDSPRFRSARNTSRINPKTTLYVPPILIEQEKSSHNQHSGEKNGQFRLNGPDQGRLGLDACNGRRFRISAPGMFC